MDNFDATIDISIIIPVYGVEKYVEKFIIALSSQTIQNFRAIFINDCTKDKSIYIIERYRKFFGERMVILNNRTNIGLSGSRNVGLDYVKDHPTKYISFLDPDDFMDADYLEDMYKLSEQNKLDLCISGLIRFDDDSKKIICTELVRMPQNIFENPGDCNELALINPCAYSKLYRFDNIKDIRVRMIKRSEDTCYLFEVLPRLRRIQFTNHAKYHYCVRGSSLTGGIDEEKYESMHSEFARILPDFDKTEAREIRDQFVAQIFIRSSLGGVCRLCFNDMKRCKSMEQREYMYLDKYVPSWRDNRYLCLTKKGMGGKKELAIKICASMYKMHIFFVFIRFYYLYTKVSGKDVRA